MHHGLQILLSSLCNTRPASLPTAVRPEIVIKNQRMTVQPCLCEFWAVSLCAASDTILENKYQKTDISVLNYTTAYCGATVA